jgi:hypothetical protein
MILTPNCSPNHYRKAFAFSIRLNEFFFPFLPKSIKVEYPRRITI